MIKSLNRISKFWYRPWAGLLLIRVVTGLIFINHGWMKLGNVDGTVAFMGGLGVPEFVVYLVILVEIVGGAMLIAGVLTRAAAVATGIVAIFAFCLVTFPAAGIKGSELERLLAAASLGIALVGSGRARIVHLFEHD